MVITFSNIKGTGGGGGATGGTVSGITLWSDETTKDYIDNAISGVTAELSAYTPTSGFCTINGSAITEGGNIEIVGTPYSAGTNIDITDYVISVTGITIPTSNTAFTNDAGYITSDALSGYSTTQEMNTAIDNAVSGKMDTSAMSAYTPTSGFSTINGSAITQGGNITVEETPYSGGTGIGVENHVISVTGDYETVVELTQAEYDALTAYTENTTYIITDAPAINMSAYTPTSGFSTINGSAITVGGNIEIETGGNYSAGTNIDITDNVISVTGITVPTKLSDLTNDEGFITSDALSGYSTTQEMNTAIDNAVSGKQDTSAMTQYYTSGETDTAISNATSGLASQSWVENKGYLTGYTETEPIFTGSPAYGITSQDITNWNSVSGKADTSRVDEIEEVAASAITDLNTRVVELSGNSVTTGTVESMITAATEGLASETYVDNAVSGKVDTSAMTAYYTSGETDTAISNATSGLASTTYVDNSVSGKVDTTAMTQYATTGSVSSVESHIDEVEEVVASALTNLHSTKQDTLVSGTNIKTINNQSLLGSGNITISGGSGSANIIELTQAQYDALTSYTQDAIYVITDAPSLELVTAVTSASTDTQLPTAKSVFTAIQNGGGGNANIIELTQAQYDALTAYTPDAIYVITDASSIELVTTVSSGSTDTQFPSAKCVYDLVGDIETLLASI